MAKAQSLPDLRHFLWVLAFLLSTYPKTQGGRSVCKVETSGLGAGIADSQGVITRQHRLTPHSHKMALRGMCSLTSVSQPSALISSPGKDGSRG